MIALISATRRLVTGYNLHLHKQVTEPAVVHFYPVVQIRADALASLVAEGFVEGGDLGGEGMTCSVRIRSKVLLWWRVGRPCTLCLPGLHSQ
jgi:hypothetical protein